MSDHPEQIAGLLAALSILLAFAGYIVNQQQRKLDQRLQLFVGGGSLPVVAPRAQRAGLLRRIAPWRRLSFGARPLQLTQAGVSLSPQRFLLIQAMAMLVAFAITVLVAKRFDLSGVGLAAVLSLGLVGGIAIP